MIIGFDWDGTIQDSWFVYKLAITRYVEKHGLALPSDQCLKDSFGSTSWEGFSEWSIPLEEQDQHRFASYDLFYELIADPQHCVLFEEMASAVRELKARGFKTAVITSRTKEPLLLALERHGLSSEFDQLLTRDCVDSQNLEHKPAPDMIRKVSAAFGMLPEQLIMIGDTYMDIQMAHNAGSRSVGVSWGVAGKEKMRTYKPTVLSVSPDEFLDDLEPLLAS